MDNRTNIIKNCLLFSILTYLLLLKVASADIALPLSFYTIPLIPVIVLIEVFIFWLVANKVKNISIGFWKLVLIIFIANIVTSLLGTFIPLYRFIIENLIWIGVAFILSVIIEWIIYLLFFRKSSIRILDLLTISFFGNFFSYVLLTLLQLVSA